MDFISLTTETVTGALYFDHAISMPDYLLPSDPKTILSCPYTHVTSMTDIDTMPSI